MLFITPMQDLIATDVPVCLCEFASRWEMRPPAEPTGGGGGCGGGSWRVAVVATAALAPGDELLLCYDQVGWWFGATSSHHTRKSAPHIPSHPRASMISSVHTCCRGAALTYPAPPPHKMMVK